MKASTTTMYNFNPRSPHGERQPDFDAAARYTAISIHAPRTGSDEPSANILSRLAISIHAPRTGSDRWPPPLIVSIAKFQSTLPARGATAEYLSTIAHRSISIHAPRTGSDLSFPGVCPS